MSRVDADELVNALVDRLALLLPPGWAVSGIPIGSNSGPLKPGDLAVFCNGQLVGGSYVRQFFEGDVRDAYLSEEERLVVACKHALSDIQDHICDRTTEAWPGKGPPNSRARIEDGHLLLSFGHYGGPFSLDPIPVASGDTVSPEAAG